jgi:hypothetical protein
MATPIMHGQRPKQIGPCAVGDYGRFNDKRFRKLTERCGAEVSRSELLQEKKRGNTNKKKEKGKEGKKEGRKDVS